MCHIKRRRIGVVLGTLPLVVLGSVMCLAEPPVSDPGKKAPPRSVKEKELMQERLGVLREVGKLATARYKDGGGTYDEVWNATRMMFDAELEACASGKERKAVLKKFLAAAKELEGITTRLATVDTAVRLWALKSKANRLQVEIFLERQKAGSP